MPYRDDAAALFARVQALEAELARARDARPDPAPAERGPLAASTPRTAGWITTLVERLPAAEQALVGELVTLFVTRRDYPSLDAVSAAALEPLIARLRAALSS
ncbi:MAG: hypothetical protein JNK64_09035 [Myxococcales bacterium]|nr:hypothetical protein [Myxococcales bacterium]